MFPWSFFYSHVQDPRDRRFLHRIQKALLVRPLWLCCCKKLSSCLWERFINNTARLHMQKSLLKFFCQFMQALALLKLSNQKKTQVVIGLKFRRSRDTSHIIVSGKNTPRYVIHPHCPICWFNIIKKRTTRFLPSLNSESFLLILCCRWLVVQKGDGGLVKPVILTWLSGYPSV